jgi:polysaccharide export outer membrane protein
MRERHPLYRLCQSDVVEITFSFAPEFDQTLTVQPDGFLPLKAVEQLQAAGKTVPELRESMRALYAPLLHDPEVTVVLKTFERPYFVATGQVAKPGKYDLLGATSVVEALAVAGGMTTDAKHSQVVLFRRHAGDVIEARLLDIKQMMNSRNLQEDLQLQPGDLIYVPQNSISKFRRFLPGSNLGMYWNPTQY